MGGDFFDVFATTGGDWTAVIGDVCGKGPEAAIVTAVARYTLRAATIQSRDPHRVLSLLNDVLLHEDRFCTVAYARITPPGADGRAARVTLACGRHPLPLLARGADVEAVGVPGSLLGVLDAPFLHDAVVTPRPGDALVLYTDGVIEARSPDGGLFGEERLRRLIGEANAAGADAAAIADRIVDEAVEYQKGDPRDDIAVVVLRVP